MFRPTANSLQVMNYENCEQLLNTPEVGCAGTIRHFSMMNYASRDKVKIMFDIISPEGSMQVLIATANLMKSPVAYQLEEVKKLKQETQKRELIVAMADLKLKSQSKEYIGLAIVAKIFANSISDEKTQIQPGIMIWNGRELQDVCLKLSTEKRKEFSFVLDHTTASLVQVGLGVQLEAFEVEETLPHSRDIRKRLLIVAMFISVESRLLLFKIPLNSNEQLMKEVNVSALVPDDVLVIEKVFGDSENSNPLSYRQREMLLTAEGLVFHDTSIGLVVKLKFNVIQN
jgi:hypothetical protein